MWRQGPVRTDGVSEKVPSGRTFSGRFFKPAVNILFLTILILFSIPRAGKAGSEEMVVLKFVLNEEEIEEFFMVLTPEDALVKRDDLDKTRLKQGLGGVVFFAGEKYVSLRSIEGLEYAVNEEEASIKVTARPDLFIAQRVGASYVKPYKVAYTKDNSAFLNYGLFYDSQNSSLDISTELGARLGDYLASSTFDYLDSDTERRGLRLLTSMRTDNREKMETLTFGDLTVSSGLLGSAIVSGGVHLAKNFSVDPYFLRYPSLSLSGTITTPSEVEVYTDGFLVRRERLKPGEFTIEEIPADIGFGRTSLVVKDIYGIERVITEPFFYSDRLLKKGLHEYGYSLGFIREDLGEKSFEYGKPALLALHNYGLSDTVKLGYALEASNGVVSGGPAASFLISTSGVLDGALSLSNSEGESGMGGFIGYFFRSRSFNVNLSLRGFSEDFSNLTVLPSEDKPSSQFNAAVGYSRRELGGISLGYSKSGMHIGPDTSRWGISYNKGIKQLATLFVTAARTRTGDAEEEDEVFIGLHAYLGRGVSASAGITDREDERVEMVEVQKSLPAGTGFGFDAQVQRHPDRTDTRAEVRYQNDYGTYGAGSRGIDGEDEYTLSAAGGVGYVSGSVFLSRPIYDSFAKVRVNEIPGVRVYYFGNEVGKTDENGEVIIPVLRSFHDNRLDIEKDDIPIDYTIPGLVQYINPPFRGGALVSFDINRVQGFSGGIYIASEGRKVPVEFSVMSVIIEDRIIEGLIGRAGEFYIENVPAGIHPAKVSYQGRECAFEIAIPRSEEVLVDMGEILCEAQ